MRIADRKQAAVDRFNEQCPVGTEVVVDLDMGKGQMRTKVKYPASILGGHTAVGWVDGIAGSYKLDRIRKAE